MRTGLLLFSFLLVLATACSEDENTAPTADTIVGEWKLVELRYDGNVFPADSLDKGPKIIKFFTDNRGLIYMWDDYELEEILSFMWEFVAGLLVMTVEGDDDPVSFPYTLSGNRMSITDTDENQEWIYQRVQ